jgi:hypothetical protein
MVVGVVLETRRRDDDGEAVKEILARCCSPSVDVAIDFGKKRRTHWTTTLQQLQRLTSEEEAD